MNTLFKKLVSVYLTMICSVLVGMRPEESTIFTKPKIAAQEIELLFSLEPSRPSNADSIEAFYLNCVAEGCKGILNLLSITSRVKEDAEGLLGRDQLYICELYRTLASGIANQTIILKKSEPKSGSWSLTDLSEMGSSFIHSVARTATISYSPDATLGLDDVIEKARTLECYTAIQTLLTLPKGKKKIVIDVTKFLEVFQRFNRRIERTAFKAFELCKVYRDNPTRALSLMDQLIEINRPAFPISLLKAVQEIFFPERIKELNKYIAIAEGHIPKRLEAEPKKDDFEEIP